jgi:hypothetical protein
MKGFSTLLLAVTAFVLASCSKPQQPDIVGRWREVGTTGLFAFHEDGTVEVSADGKELRGSYSFITKSKLKIELAGKGASIGPVVYQLALSGTKMTLTDMAGQKSEYLKAE